MATHTIILASLLLLITPMASAAPLTPEHAWRQMQGLDGPRRVTAPRSRSLYRPSPQLTSRTKTRPVTQTKVKSTDQSATTKSRTTKPSRTRTKDGKGWFARLTGALIGSKSERTEQAPVTENKTDQKVRTVAARGGKVVAVAREKVATVWQRVVGRIKTAVEHHKQRRQARAAGGELYWRQPMLVPAGQPIPAEILMGGMRLNKLQNYSQGTLLMLHKGGLVTEAEYRILTQARMGLPQMMPTAPMEQPAAPPPQNAPMTPPPPQQ